MKFLFDLDGTVTSEETLPVIASHFRCQEKIASLTNETVLGNVPFVESFIRRVNILGGYSVAGIRERLAGIPLYPELKRFIDAHREDCAIVTGNLTCWCEGLFQKLGCRCYGSEAQVEDDRVVRLKRILRKEDIVDLYHRSGEEVVFIGDGHNDLEAMRRADVGIAVGMTHNPAGSLLEICDYVVFDEKALCRQLRQLCEEKSMEKSVIIPSAGLGSRLGLGLTKALMKINGRSLISWQLNLFRDVEDLRIVIGFQARDVIEEVCKYRKDVIFCYNHRYFETKTGASFYLGARHANAYVMEWDGDLLVHPDDLKQILALEGEFLCYAEKSSEEAVWVRTDGNGYVHAFSRDSGDWEWTGPVCINKEHLSYSADNVFNIIERVLPIRGVKVQAFDIDTYHDYQLVQEKTRDWFDRQDDREG
jgi:HAD superfamily phosphoserine phosphatase-like hydrolase